MNLAMFLSGATMMGYLVAGCMFLRFWKKTADRLFYCFSLAFFILSTERIVLLTLQGHEFTPFVYILRLCAFAVLVMAIYQKNR
jgi:hypothetical protein